LIFHKIISHFNSNNTNVIISIHEDLLGLIEFNIKNKPFYEYILRLS
jgi:hypothetical protein